MLIPIIDEVSHLSLQIGQRGERAAANGTLGDETEPALDLIESGAVGRNVMDVVARPPRQPGFDRGIFVGSVVVRNPRSSRGIAGLFYRGWRSAGSLQQAPGRI